MKRFVKLLSIGLMYMSLFACGNENVDSTEKEKVVNVYMPSPADLQTKLKEGFEAKYKNITMQVTSGTTGELLAKIEAEKNDPICDVLILASWSDGLNNLSKLNLLSYVPVGSENISNAFKEESNKIYGTSASAVGVIYNTDRVKKDEIEKFDWSDFTDEEKIKTITTNGKIPTMSIPDPTKSGAAKDFFAGMMTSQFANEDLSSEDSEAYNIIKGWKANGLTNGGGNKTVIANVEGSELDVLLAGVDYNAYADKQKGKHVDIYFPKGGTVINARPAMILKDGSHNEEAKLVMDYLCSDDAQQLVSNAYLIPGNTSLNAKRPTNVNQFSNMDWNIMANKGTTIAQTIQSILKK